MANREGMNERLEMEAAARASERTFPKTDSNGKPLPKRYKLYDKIAKHLTERIMNVIIAATVVLIIAAIAIGMVTGR